MPKERLVEQFQFVALVQGLEWLLPDVWQPRQGENHCPGNIARQSFKGLPPRTVAASLPMRWLSLLDSSFSGLC